MNDSVPDELTSNPALAGATAAEFKRFWVARKKNVAAATSMLANYLEWRKQTLPLTANHPRLGVELPLWMHFYGRARDGSPICHVQGPMYDPEKASPQQYALATAQMFDEALPRDSEAKMTLLVDCRGDERWPSPGPTTFVPVVRSLSSLLGDNFPERLNRLIVYPVPFLGRALWRTVEPFIDTNTANKVVLLPGPSKPGAPCPVKLAEYVDYTQIREDCQHRHLALLKLDAENRPPPNSKKAGTG